MKQKENQGVIQDEIYNLIIPIEILTYFEIIEVVSRNLFTMSALCGLFYMGYHHF
jgi:hypothetical protein